MKKRFLFLLPLVSLGLFSIPALADEETPLGEEMSSMNSDYKAIRRLVKSGDVGDGAELARTAADTMLKSLAYVPVKTEKVDDEAQKLKDIANYKRLVAETYVTFCEIEIAFLDEDLEKVEALIDDLRDLKREGHKGVDGGHDGYIGDN